MLRHWLPAVPLSAALLAVAACGTQPNAPPAAPPTAAETRGNAESDGPPLFEDVTAASGVDFTYRNGEDTANHLAILESLGGGVALIDYNGDGRLDVFLPGGGGYDGPDKKQIVGRPCKLYANLGGWKFRDVTAEAGLDRLAGGTPWFYSHGAAVGDYDRDGRPDLLVTGWGRVALFRNEGGRFADVSAAAGLGTGITWATSAAFADLDADGFPDLYVCQYVDWSFAKHPKCTYDGKTPDVCPPKNFDGLPHKLYRNTGKGSFEDVGQEAGLSPGGPDRSKGLGVLIADVNDDRKPDVYVANDTVDNFLYVNRSARGRLKFEERAQASLTARDDRGSPNGSMGLDAGDPERSGKPALWVTNYENELHALYRNDSRPDRPFFTFRSTASGVAAIGQKYVGWGTAFVDVDLDGWEDLFVANGHAIRYPTGTGSARKQRPVLLRNREKPGRPEERQFVDISARVGAYHTAPRLARGVAFGDLDNDGRTDLVISHVNEPVAVLRGVGGPIRHWIGVELAATGHADAVGAKVAFEAGGARQTRFAKRGGSYASSGDRRLLFGLGDQARGRLSVTWPDGTEQHFDGVEADHYYRVTQGRERPEAVPTGGR